MRLLRSRHAVWLTHGSAMVMTTALFVLILYVPFGIAFIPTVLLTHRIGVMMHEYIHGIPFRRYANCLKVLAFYDGLISTSTWPSFRSSTSIGTSIITSSRDFPRICSSSAPLSRFIGGTTTVLDFEPTSAFGWP